MSTLFWIDLPVETGGGGGGPPTGAAGGDLGGTYPNPTVVSVADITTGVLSIVHGGTGQTTAPNAINALLPSQGGNTGDVLSTNGTVASWITPPGGAPTGAAGGDLGGTYPNPTVLNVAHVTTGVLAIANGGTNANNAISAFLNLAPSVTGNSNKILTNNGSLVSWSFITNSNLSGSAAITNANLAQMAANTIKGNNTGIPATPIDLTAAQTLAVLGLTGAISSVGLFGSSPNADGASTSGGVLTLQPADGSNPGGLSTTAQTIAGSKNFSSLTKGNGFTTNSYFGAFTECFGNGAGGVGSASVSLGVFATVDGNNAIALGNAATAAGNNSIVLGTNSNDGAGPFTNVIVIGQSLAAQASNEITLGDNTQRTLIGGPTDDTFYRLQLSGAIRQVQQSTPGTNPPAGSDALYFKSDDNLYSLTSAGVETLIGGGGSPGVSSLNTLTGNLTLAAGTNITITPSGGNTLTIDAAGGGGSPASPSTSIQFNNSGAFGGSANMEWDGTYIKATAFTSSPGTGASSEKFGQSAAAAGTNQLAVGFTALATNTGSVAIGTNAAAGGVSSVVLGTGAADNALNDSVIVGGGAATAGTGPSNIAVGFSASAGSSNLGKAVAIGSSAGAADNAIAIGTSSSASSQGISIGNSSIANANSIAIGSATITTASNQLVFGANSHLISNVYFGNGVSNTTAAGVTINGSGILAGTSNVGGGTIAIAGGQGTGTGASGLVEFKIAPAGSSGSTVNALVNAVIIDQNGNLTTQISGKGLRVKEGTNCKQGISNLVAGTVVVANTSVTGQSRIFVTCQSLGGITTPAALSVRTRAAGTSFTVKSSSGVDTSTIAWEIFEPS